MPLIISSNSRNKNTNRVYEKVSEGVHTLEIVNIKEVETNDEYGTHSKVQFLFLCRDEDGSNGKPKTIVQRFTKSLNEKAMLRRFLCVVLGLKNVDGFDLETLQHATFDGVVQHVEGKWVNITSVIPKTLKILSPRERQTKLSENRRKAVEGQLRARGYTDERDTAAF